MKLVNRREAFVTAAAAIAPSVVPAKQQEQADNGENLGARCFKGCFVLLTGDASHIRIGCDTVPRNIATQVRIEGVFYSDSEGREWYEFDVPYGGHPSQFAVRAIYKRKCLTKVTIVISFEDDETKKAD